MTTERPTIASCPHCRALLLRTENALIHPSGVEREELTRALGDAWHDHPTTRFDGRFHRCHGREPIVFAPHDRLRADEGGDDPDPIRPHHLGRRRERSGASAFPRRLLALTCLALLGLAGLASAQEPRTAASSVFTGDPIGGRLDLLRLNVVRGESTSPSQAPSRPESESWKGQQLANGRYEIVDALREASTGVAYLAHDRNLDADVVVEVPTLPPEHRRESNARFVHAVQTLARLAHPHLVRLTEVGTRNDAPYVITEHRAGGSLRFRRPVGPDGRPAPVAPDTLEQWLPSISEALGYLHARDQVHRDVSPANILFDETGRAALGGLGMSPALAEWSRVGAGGRDQAVERSEGGQTAAAAPVIVAPEVVEGKPVDGRADQFALAATVYELLSGRAPFEAPSQRESPSQGDESVGAPTELHRILPSIPAALSSAVQRGLARDPRQRFPDCPSFARAVLSAVHESRATPAAVAVASSLAPSASLTRLQGSSLTKPLPLGLACGGLIVLLGASTWSRRRRQPRTDRTQRVGAHSGDHAPEVLPLAAPLDRSSRSLPTDGSTERSRQDARSLEFRPHRAESPRGPHRTTLPALIASGPEAASPPALIPSSRELPVLPDLDPTADAPRGRLADNLLPVLASPRRSPLMRLGRKPLVPAPARSRAS